MKRIGAILAVVLVCSTAQAAHRRAVGTPRVDDGTPATWLALHASTIRTTDLDSDSSDLVPFTNLVGGAHVVGLGDGTHGTHEFYTLKLRLIDVLVRQLGFDTIAFEGPFALFDRIDAYVQGGGGDPRIILGELGTLGYHFWDAEEIADVIDWVHAYNANRGSRPAVHIAGADVWDGKSAAQNVIAYLQRVDPSAATEAQRDYQCVLALTSIFSMGCMESDAQSAYAIVASRSSDLGSGEGAHDYAEALHSARVVVQSFTLYERDRNMAENVEWLQEHRGESRHIIYWGHTEHIGKVSTEQAPLGSAGMFLSSDLGSDYVAVGTLTGTGQYMTWVADQPVVYAVPDAQPGTYESFFEFAARPAAFIPMRGNVPQWLSTPSRYFFAGTAPVSPPYLSGSLPAKLDAVIYIHATTPIRVLKH